MRTFLWLSAFTAAVLLLSPARTWTQQNDQPSPQSQTPSQTEERPLAQQESVADAARRARERKKEAPRNVKTFTNDNLPTAGGISTVGGTAGAPPLALRLLTLRERALRGRRRMTKRRGGGDFRPCTASSNKIKPISTSCSASWLN